MPSIKVKFYYDGILYKEIVALSEEEYVKYVNRVFPIEETNGTLTYLDKDNFCHRDGDFPAVIGKNMDVYYVHGKPHRTTGPAFLPKGGLSGDRYSYDGVCYKFDEWKKKCKKPILFLREKIKTLKNLLEIPELYDEVYYKHKNDFLSLLNKV